MRKLLLTVFGILLGTTLMAQIPNFGIRAGLTATEISTDVSATFSSENTLGYQAGAFVRLNFNKFYIQPELVYNHRSTKLEYEVIPVVDFENQKVGARTEMKIGTFDIPALFGFKIIDTKMMNIRFFAGPVISFATNKSLSYEYTTADGEEFNGDVYEPITTDDFNQTTWYGQAGVGVDVLFLTFDIRYEKGLSDLYNSGDVNFKNNVWVFTLGLKFL
ncbi:MAG: outer membrane beta-barrel protein [Bacteroidales bacterium]|nr:outer membrane beta-barrel protein [Bacteroidales bacterium]